MQLLRLPPSLSTAWKLDNLHWQAGIPVVVHLDHIFELTFHDPVAVQQGLAALHANSCKIDIYMVQLLIPTSLLKIYWQ